MRGRARSARRKSRRQNAGPEEYHPPAGDDGRHPGAPARGWGKYPAGGAATAARARTPWGRRDSGASRPAGARNLEGARTPARGHMQGSSSGRSGPGGARSSCADRRVARPVRRRRASAENMKIRAAKPGKVQRAKDDPPPAAQHGRGPRGRARPARQATGRARSGLFTSGAPFRHAVAQRAGRRRRRAAKARGWRYAAAHRWPRITEIVRRKSPAITVLLLHRRHYLPVDQHESSRR